MLSVPRYGWVHFTIDDFTFCASYLTDVPQDFIDALVAHFKYNISTTVELDGESDGNCTILFNAYHDTVSAIHHVPEFDDRVETIFWDKNILSIAQEFVRDVEENMEAWENWGYDDEPKKIDLTELKAILAEKTVVAQ